MPDRDEWFEEHGIHQALTAASERLNRLGITEETLPTIERFKFVCAWTQARLAGADPMLMPEASLDRARDALNQMVSNLDTFESSSDSANLASASANADAVLEDASRWQPQASDVEQAERSREAAASYRRSLGQLLRGAEDQVQALKEAAEQQQTELGDRARGFQSQLDTVSQTLANHETRLDTAISTFQAQFSESQETHRADFENLMRERGEASRELISRMEESHEATRKGLEDNARAALDQLKEFQAQAEKVVGAIGATGMAGGFKIYADQQKKDADWLRWFAIAALVAAVGVAIYAFTTVQIEDFSWNRFLSKFLVVIPLGAITYYAGAQSASHRDAERIARRAELELASLDPYVALLTDDQGRELKLEVARRFFAQPLIGGRIAGRKSQAALASLIGELRKGSRVGEGEG